MDESVIFVDGPAGTSNSSQRRTTLYRDFFVREIRQQSTRRLKRKKTEGAVTIIDLSDEPDNEPQRMTQAPAAKRSPDPNADLLCPVCFKKLLEASLKATPCGHVFCKECIETVVEKTKNCPKCRQHVTLTDLICLYL